MGKMEADDLLSTVDSLTKSKLAYEKQCRSLEDTYAELKSKCEEQEKEISENAANKARTQTEVNELKRTLEEKDQINGQLTRQKNSVTQSNDDVDADLRTNPKPKMCFCIKT